MTPLPHIQRHDLQYALLTALEVGEQDLDDLRDIRRAATVLTPDECQAALLGAIESRTADIRSETTR